MMKKLLSAFLMLLSFMAFSQDNVSQELEKLHWQNGPTTGLIGDKASIKVPAGYVFLDNTDTQRFLELMGNPPDDRHYMIAPKALNWFAVFEFDATGYIKDDEKIDANDLLKKLQSSDAASNEERRRLGMHALYTEGWQVAPHYDEETKRLEWGMRLRDESGEKNVNYSSRILGRTGVMSAVLVSDIETLAQNTREFKKTLHDFNYNAGEKYSEFKPGDHVAEFGLAALVLGGAAAVATKKGVWAVIGGFLAAGWKLVVGLVVAGFAVIGRLFKKQ